MSKGSSRRPGEGFEDGWERIFKPKPAEKKECSCDFEKWATEQGCEICSPEYREQKEG